jgi:hypothetical protein
MPGGVRHRCHMRASGWRGEAPPPPAHPPRPTPLRRWIAVGVVAGVLTGGGWGAAALFRRQVATVRAPDTPFHPGTLVAVGEDGSPREVRSGGRQVLLYVSAHCRYCRAELAAWSRMLASDVEATRPLVVLAPDTEPGEMGDVLMTFQNRWVSDPSGAVGRALRVRSVPFFAVLDSAGFVVEAGVGINTPERRARLGRVKRRTP